MRISPALAMYPLLLSILLVEACLDPEAARRNAVTRDLESERSALIARINALSIAADELAVQYQRYGNDIERHRIATKAYMMNHKLAVAALLSGAVSTAVAIDPESSFTGEMQVVAGGVALLIGAWAVSNAAEVMEVADVLVQADSHLRSLEAAASDIASQWQSKNADLGLARGQLGAIDFRLAELRAVQGTG